MQKAKEVIESWANAEWFTNKPAFRRRNYINCI